VRSAIVTEAGGRILEAGAGASPFKYLLRKRGDEVVTLDVEDRQGGVDILGDIQDMHEVESSSIDTILCTQVLEHVRSPSRAFTEMARVLKPGGVLILSAPHLSMIHEAPHDYFRFTNYGLAALCLDSGFAEPQIRSTSGLLAFLVHPLSVGLMTLAGSWPGLRWPAWALNYLLLVRAVALLDQVLGVREMFPTDHLVIARRLTQAGI